jgi:transposase
MNTTTIGLDIAKSYFQVHGVDARGRTTVQRQLRRAQLLTFFEALSQSAREAILGITQDLGHRRL